MKDVGKEYQRLINDYLVGNSNILCCGGFHALSSGELSQYLHKLEPFEAPDMFAVEDDTLVMIEHFEFDASRKTQKGMQGKKEESLLLGKICQRPLDSKFCVDKIDYSTSVDNWTHNFEYCFENHYKKIPSYNKNLKDKIGSRKVVIGFLAEHLYSPLLKIDGDIAEVPYLFTKQFLDFFLTKAEVDFVLFGTYYSGKKQLFYMDHGCTCSKELFIDLKSDTVALSHLSYNEAIVSGGFIEDP